MVIIKEVKIFSFLKGDIYFPFIDQDFLYVKKNYSHDLLEFLKRKVGLDCQSYLIMKKS